MSLFDETARWRLAGPLVREALAAAEPESDDFDVPSRAQTPDALDWLLAALCRSWLPDELLMKVDKMTMAVGLEARTPFLDHRLVEDVARLPSSYKIRGWTNKYLLRRLGGTLLPAEVAGRGKDNFEVPVDAWFRGELRQLLLDTLDCGHLRDSGIIDPVEARRLADEHLDRKSERGLQLWTILCLGLWYERFIGGRPVGTTCSGGAA